MARAAGVLMTLHSQVPSGHVRPCAQAILCCQASFLHPGVHASYAAGGLGGVSAWPCPQGTTFRGQRQWTRKPHQLGYRGSCPPGADGRVWGEMLSPQSRVSS